MTRINIVPVEELFDQHLFAEYREIKMIPKSLARSKVSKSDQDILNSIPSEFCLGKGHVTYFYDKGKFLYRRYAELCEELRRRGINYTEATTFDPDGVMASGSNFYNDYIPSSFALSLIRQRIREKVDMKPNWYRMTKNVL